MSRRPAGVHTKHLTADERQRVRTLKFDAGKTYREIEDITHFTRMQIRTACNADLDREPKKRGPRKALSDQQEQELVQFVCASKKNRRMSFFELSLTLFNAVFGLYAIRSALRRLGFRRRIARRKPPISEVNRVKRLDWALEHRNWTVEQWAQILWSDETWITGGHHRRQWVTRRLGEEWDETYIVERHQRRGGWMFWGSFSGATGKGPGVFWEKDWGTITSETYREHLVPVIDGWIRLCRRDDGEELIFMQDGAPSHSAGATVEDLAERGIQLIYWPPYSPDLNPIESVWNWMKDYIEDKYGLEEKPSYDKLRGYVIEAWNAVPEEWLRELLAGMPQRCEDVIRANGMHTRN